MTALMTAFRTHAHVHTQFQWFGKQVMFFHAREREGPVSSRGGTSSARGPNSTWSVTINPPRLSQTPHPPLNKAVGKAWNSQPLVRYPTAAASRNVWGECQHLNHQHWLHQLCPTLLNSRSHRSLHCVSRMQTACHNPSNVATGCFWRRLTLAEQLGAGDFGV